MKKSLNILILLSIFISLGLPDNLKAQIWERCSKSHRSTQIIPASGKTIFSLSSHLFTSTDLGSLFQVASFPDADPSGFAVGVSGNYYATSSNGFYFSTDGAENWTLVDTKNVPLPITSLLVREGSGNVPEDEIFLGTDTGVFVRRHSGGTWEKLFGSDAPILQIAAFNKNIYIRTLEEVFASHDTGRTWKNISPTSFGTLTALVTTSEKDVFIAINSFPNGAVLQSADTGNTWDGAESITFSNRSFQTLIANDNGDIYLGGGLRDTTDPNIITAGYVYRLLNNSSEWTDYSDGLPVNDEVIGMGFSSPEYGKVFASTDSSGTFRTLLPSKVAQGMPNGISLSQNFPNPANIKTQFAVITDHTIKAEVTIFNALGKNIEEIGNGELSSGTHFFMINTKDYANGTYFIRLQTSEGIINQPFVVAR